MIGQRIAEKLKKEYFVTIFLVQLYLDVVPEVLLMVGMNFLAYKSPNSAFLPGTAFDVLMGFEATVSSSMLMAIEKPVIIT